MAAALVGHGRCLGCCLGRCLGCCLGRLIRRLCGQVVDHFFSLRQVVDHFFALRQGQLGRLGLVFTTRRSASRPWRRLRLLHRPFEELDVIQKQHEGQRRAPQSDDLAFEVCQPEAQVSQGDGAPNGHEVPVIGAGLHDGAHAALQRCLGQDVVPQIAQHPAGVGQLGAAQVDLVVAIHAYELKDLLPTGDEAWAEHVVDAEGLARRGGRRGGEAVPVPRVRQLCMSNPGLSSARPPIRRSAEFAATHANDARRQPALSDQE